MAPHLLVIPYPAQGHMLPLLDFASELAAGDLSITIVVTEKNFQFLYSLLSKFPDTIKPLVLPFPTEQLPSSFPCNAENTKDLPPTHVGTMIYTMSLLYEPLLHWVKTCPSPPTAIISDMFCGWTNNLAKKLGIPRLVFSPSGAFALATNNFLWRHMPKKNEDEGDSFQLTFSSLPESPTFFWCQLSTTYRSYREGDFVSEMIKKCFRENIESWGWVVNTFDELEFKYLEHLKKDLSHQRVWAVGPLNALHEPDARRGGQSSLEAEEVQVWLDKREERSVAYVCFGSQAVLSARQAAALAAGLERSGTPFVWAVKSGGDTDAVLEDFEEKVKDKGLVIRGWAPQLLILGHKAVGSFVTHCGWNSTLEGITSGVAMLTWPMGAEQFMNAKLLEESIGLAVRICEGQDGIPDPEKLALGIEIVMRSDPSRRAKAMELKHKAYEAVKEGGSSWKDTRALLDVLSHTPT